MKISVSNNKKSDCLKINNSTAPCKNSKTTAFKNANSSLASMDLLGRAFVNMSKMPFRGDFHDYTFEECLFDTDLSESTINELMKLPPEQRKEAIDLYQQGVISENTLCKFAKCDIEVRQKLAEVLKKGIYSSVLFDLIKAEENIESILIDFIQEKSEKNDLAGVDKEIVFEKCDELNHFLDKGFDPMLINAALKSNIELNDDKLKKLASILNFTLSDNMGYYYYNNLIEDDERYQRVIEMLDNGILDLEAINDLTETQERYNRGLKFLNLGYSAFDSSQLSDIQDEEFLKKVLNLMQKTSYMASVAESILLSPDADKQIANLDKFLANGIKPRSEMLKLSDDSIDEIFKLIKDGYTIDEISKLTAGSSHVDNYLFTELVEKNKKENEKWNDFITNSIHKEQYEKELDVQDIKFLKQHVFDNKYYNPDEYIKLYKILKNLKTLNGDNILSNELFYKSAQTNGLGDFSLRQGDELNKNIEELLSVNPKSEKANYLKTIIKLIIQGHVNPLAIGRLSDSSELKSLKETRYSLNFNSKGDWDISDNLKNDIDLISQEGINSKNYIDKYIPSYKTADDGVKNTKIGDAFIVDGEKYIRLKTSDNKSQTVELTKETYAKLFPPVDRFLSSQRVMGNCYCKS